MSLKIIRAGILDTVQDMGRYGHQHLGINTGGVMDRFSASLANALLGKEANAPVIELHFPAAQILFQKPCVICLAGADFTPLINNAPILLHQPVMANENTVLKFMQLKSGARCYLATLNELQLEPWLNSYSTNLKAGAGGYKGRRLLDDDELIFDVIHLPKTQNSFKYLPWRYNNDVVKTNEVAFIPGNEWNWLTTKSQTSFLNNGFTITPASDRMGYRLQGEALEQTITEQLVSSAVSFGTIQLLPNGQTIVLMAGHQTTGGYPRLGHVISAHLPRLAQMKAGEQLKFAMTNVEAAEEKLMAQQQHLLRLQNTCNVKMKNWLHAN